MNGEAGTPPGVPGLHRFFKLSAAMKHAFRKSNARVALLTPVVAILVSACAKVGTSDVAGAWTSDPVEIILGGSVSGDASSGLREDGVPSGTRAIVNAEHGELSVSFARLDQQEDDGLYAAYTTLSTALPATIAATSGDPETPAAITFDNPQYYLSRTTNNNTKLLGWHPQATPSEGVVTWSLDAQTDIMLSQELVGNKSEGERFGVDGKIFEFRHCLTQLKVKAYALDDAAPTVWGRITSITFREQANVCKLTLPDAVTFEGSAELALPQKNWDADAPISYPLAFERVEAAQASPCGYALLKPVEAGGSLPIVVATENGQAVETSVPVPAEGFQSGKAYEILLKFSATAIEPAATISAWVDDPDRIEVVM